MAPPHPIHPVPPRHCMTTAPPYPPRPTPSLHDHRSCGSTDAIPDTRWPCNLLRGHTVVGPTRQPAHTLMYAPRRRGTQVTLLSMAPLHLNTCPPPHPITRRGMDINSDASLVRRCFSAKLHDYMMTNQRIFGSVSRITQHSGIIISGINAF